MTLTSDILVNIDLVKQHKKDFLLTLLLHNQSHREVDWSHSYYCCGDILRSQPKRLREQTGLTAKTIYKYLKTYSNTYSYAGSIAVLPPLIWDRLMEDIKLLAAAEKNGVVRTFCYFICQSWAYQDFSRSQELIAKDLDNRVIDVRWRIQWLVQHQYIFIKHHQVNFAGKDRHACVYQLYNDEVPSYYAGTSWWIGHLAERARTNIDEILAEFKNTF